MRYSQIKQALREAEIIDEVSMSPSNLEKFANSPEAEGMLIGIEFEMCVPNANVDDDSGEGEYDYDMDERANDIDDIIRFFQEGDNSTLSSNGADRLRGEMWEQFLDWQSDKIQEDLDTDELNDRIRDRLDGDIDFDDMTELAREQWKENNPDENPEDKASEDEIHQLALRLNEKTLDDMMEDTDSREYQRAYDDVRQEMEDDMRDSYDQSDWLRDLGIDYMSEAERQWGLDWPHWTYYSSGGEADVDQVAEDFSDYTGFQAKGYNNYHSASRSDQQAQGYFIIEPDGSIDADEGDAGLEFISPAMPLKDGLAMIKKVKEWASAAGCYTNKSTGLHMNISVPNMTIDNLDYVKLALFLGDEHVLKEFDRTYNSYAKSAMKVVKEKIEQNPENASALLAKMKEHVNAAASKLVHSGITNKYTSINTKDKYVEFRGPGGDYLDQDIPKLINTALRAAQALRIATDDGAYKQEYAKKLYKLISPNEGDWTDPNNSVALFSRYALGQINKSELVDNVRQAQVARKEKKGEDQQYWVMNKDGSGGKQMVHATSSTEAIIKGGKQMGMSREASISTLKAELMERPQDDNAPPESLSQSWKDWVEDTLPTVTVDTINSVRQRIINGGDQLSGPASAWIIKQIDNELRSRMDQGVVDGNETRWKVTIEWNRRGPVAGYEPVYVDADSPRQAKIKAAPIFDRQMNLGSGTVNPNELEAIATTQDAGAVHAISQDWREWVNALPQKGTATINDYRRDIVNGHHNTSLSSQAQRDAVVRAIDDELRRRQDRGETSREVFDSLPVGWQQILTQVSNLTDENLQRYVTAAPDIDSNILSDEQKTFVSTALNTELRRRNNNSELAASAGNAENAVRASLPDAHRAWLDDIDNQSDMSLINVLRNLTGNTSNLSEQQAAYFRVQVKHALRRRGISPDDAPATQGELNLEPTAAQDGAGLWMIGNHTYGRETFRANSRNEAIQAYAERNDISVDDLTSDRSFVAQLTEPEQTNESIDLIRRLAGLK